MVKTEFGYDVSPGIQEFRVRLFNEHFGFRDDMAVDYMD